MSSDPDSGCTGKLPFQLLESLQRGLYEGGKQWADAIPFSALNYPLITIDTVELNPAELSGSILASIMHSMNDVYCSGGVPRVITLSLHLPLDTDLESLTCINQSIVELTSVSGCVVGKVHTMRGPKPYMSSVAVVGDRISCNLDMETAGSVVIKLDKLLAARADAIISAHNRWAGGRVDFLQKCPGPKKDVSGDGLAGALVQLALQNACQIEIDLQSLARCCSNCDVEGSLYEQNYISYASLIVGLSNLINERVRCLLFRPFFVGPLICLAPSSYSTNSTEIVKIGEFKSGQAKVSVR